MAFDQAGRKDKQRDMQIVYSTPKTFPLSLDPWSRRLMVIKSRNKVFSVKNRFSGSRVHTLFPEPSEAEAKCPFLGKKMMP